MQAIGAKQAASTVKRASSQRDRDPSGREHWRSSADRLWTRAVRCVPDVASLAKPKTHVRLVQAQGSAGQRYAEAVTADRLEGLLTQESGIRHHFRGQEPIGRNPDRKRFYAKYRFAREVTTAGADDGQAPQSVVLFVKRGPGVSRPELEQFLNGLHNRNFCAPKFLWHFRVAGVRVGTWEFVEGASPCFSEREPGDILRVIEAVAGINAVPESALRGLAVPLQVPYVHPVAQRAAAIMAAAMRDDGDSLRGASAELEGFAKIENRLIARYHALPHRGLTHNDIRPANLFVRSGDDRIVVADWNSARIGVPGASLRFLAPWSASVRTELAEQYVRCMAQLGVKLALADVLFAISATHLFKALHDAVNSADPGKLRVTLRHAARLVDAE